MAALDVLRTNSPRPTAVVCFNDMVALGVFRAAEEMSLRVPEDISIMGFDGLEMVHSVYPNLSTLDIQPKQLGIRSAEVLLQVINNQVDRGPVNEIVPVRVLDRGSVRSI